MIIYVYRSSYLVPLLFIKIAGIYIIYGCSSPKKLYLYVLIRHIDLWTYGQIGQYFTT